jgi:seryl-tRNA synthetase
MLVVSDIINDREKVVKGLKKRNFPDPEATFDQLVEKDKTRKELQGQLDETLASANSKAREIGGLMKEGKKEEAELIKQETSALKQKSTDLKDNLSNVQSELTELLYSIPNIPNEIVPVGNTEDDNEIVLEWGDSPTLSSDSLPHWELIKKYDIIDFELGVKLTGAGFPVYKGKGAKLQRALINFFLSEAELQGYLEIQPPIVINEASGYGTGQLPDKEGQMYHITQDDLYLIPTAEVPITNIYRDVILQEKDLPVKNTGYTPCFRREAGSWGAHVRGLNRLHQFDKVEIVRIEHPDNSYDTLDEMSTYIQSLIQKLDLKYRVLRLCAGDLGFTSALTYDMEVWSAAQEKWLEVSSVSNFETFQANRLKLRFKGEDNKTRLLHTLNGSALALPRIMAAILENNQTPEGIHIPKVLQPFTGFDLIS